jgi:ATP-binding cassette subfamily B protein
VSDHLDALAWPGPRLGEALNALGRKARLGVRAVGDPAPPEHILAAGGVRLDRWVEAASAWMGLEAEPVECPYTEVGRLVAGAGPALLRWTESAGPRFLALLGGSRRRVRLLTPGGAVVPVAMEAVRAALCHEAESRLAADVDRALAEGGVSRRRRSRARVALLGQLLVEARVAGGWLVRPAPGAPALVPAREAGLGRPLAVVIVAQVLGSLSWVGSWWLLGGMSTTGRFDPGWLLAWLLLLLSTVPCRLALSAAGGGVAIRAGALIKRRLLAGSLALEGDEIRRSGIGRLFSRVLESGVVEQMGLTGGFLALTGTLELALAVPVLAAGAGAWPHAALLVAWSGLTLAIGAGYARARRAWTAERLDMTNDLVERLVGHRTRLAQELPGRRNDDEDRALDRYVGPSRRLDHLDARLRFLVPRGWLLVGLLGLAPAFVGGGGATALAVGLGGVVLAYQALRALGEALARVADAVVAWERVGPLWSAAADREPAGQPDFVVPGRTDAPGDGRYQLDARDLVFRYRDRAEPVLRGVTLLISAGARVLLQGPSGGGKSTLAALLAGLRVADAGLLLWDGLDRNTLGGEGWRNVSPWRRSSTTTTCSWARWPSTS